MVRTRPLRLATALATLGLLGSIVSAASAAPVSTSGPPPVSSAVPSSVGKTVFFVGDGMRQDLIERFAATGGLGTMRQLMKDGVRATGNGLLTEAPPNTGAGWYSLATGAWPGVHGSTNNTFHINGSIFSGSTSSFGAGIPQAEMIAQSAERCWPQGRPGGVLRRRRDEHLRADGRLPALLLRPGRRDQLHLGHGHRRHDRVAGRPVRPSGRLRRERPVRGRGARRRLGLDQRAGIVLARQGDAPQGDRLRRRQVRPQRVHLRFRRTTPPWTTTASCSPPPRTAPRAWRPCAAASGPTSRSRWSAARSTARPRASTSRSRSSRRTSRRSASSTRRSRGRSRPGPPGPARPASRAISRSTWPRRSRAPRRPTSPSSRPASSPRTRTSSRDSSGSRPTGRSCRTSSTAITRTSCSPAIRRPTSSSTSSWGW